MTRHFLCAALLCASAAQASPLPNYPFVTAQGKAERWLAPDVGTLQFDVAAQDVQSQRATATMEDVAGKVEATLIGHGITADDIDASDITKKALELSKPTDENTQSYCLVKHFAVKVHDLSQWNAILQALLAQDNVEGLSVDFDRSDKDAINAELLADAAKDAGSYGSALARSFGRKLGAAVAISQGSLAAVGQPFGLTDGKGVASERKARAEGDYSVPTAIRFAQAVNAVFRLK